jgi:molybdate transport system regulatory protein
MEPRSKLWIEKDGKLALSDYRVRLLKLIAETGSLSEAAARMQLSYRRAWGKVKEIEANLGLHLIESAVGGAGGGGSRLTQEGQRLVDMYDRFSTAAEDALEREFVRVFGAAPPPADQ